MNPARRAFSSRATPISGDAIHLPVKEEAIKIEAKPSEVSGLFNENLVNFRDFASVLADLRRAGEKPKSHTILQGLHELSSVEGRQAREQRKSQTEDKIVRLPDTASAIGSPNSEALLLRMQDYESELEEAQRKLAQTSHLHEELSDLQRQLARARKREEELNNRLRASELKIQESASIQEELHRCRTQLQRAQQKEVALRSQLDQFRQGVSSDESVVIPFSPSVVLPEISDREVQLTRELAAALTVAEQASQNFQEVISLRQALEEEQKARQELESRWQQAQFQAARAQSLETDLQSLQVTLGELLHREQSLQAQVDLASEHASYLEGVENEVRGLEEQLLVTRTGEKALTEELETAMQKAALAADLEDQIVNLQEILGEFHKREEEWSARLDLAQHAHSQVTMLSGELEESSRLLAESQDRETRFTAQLQEIQQQLAQSPSFERISELEAQVADRTAALHETKVDHLANHAHVEELRTQLAAAQKAELRLIENEANLSLMREREIQLVQRLEAASERAVSAEQQLEKHTEMLEWGHERTQQIHAQLAEARTRLAQLFPTETALVQEPLHMAAPSSFDSSLEALDVLLGQLNHELSQAHQYKDFLQQELTKAQESVSADTAGLTIESVELRKCLAETIEIELSRQTDAVAELMRREGLIRSRLEKSKPQSMQAQSLQAELSGQQTYRDDLSRREANLASLLREVLTSLRSGPRA